MRTMHPTLLVGPADWDAQRMPLEEFRARQGHLSDHESQNAAYARLFADFGIDVESLSPPEAATRIARRPELT